MENADIRPESQLIVDPEGTIRLQTMAQLKKITVGPSDQIPIAQVLNLGHVTVLTGVNNCGKSTLGRAIVAPHTCTRHIEHGTTQRDAVVSVIKKLRPKVSDGILGQAALRVVESALSCGSVAPNFNNGEEMRAEIERYWMAGVLREVQFSIPAEDLYRAYLSTIPGHPRAVTLGESRPLRRIQAGAGGEVIPLPEAIVRRLHELSCSTPGSSDAAIFNQIVDAFKQITGGLRFQIEFRGTEIIPMFENQSNGWFAAEQSGFGMSSVLSMLLCVFLPDYELVVIEEPENFLHPDMQRRLMGVFGEQVNRQFVLVTHSNVIVASPHVDALLMVEYDNGVRVLDGTSRASALRALGYSVLENIKTDLIVLVEGPGDTLVYEQLFLKNGVGDKYNVKMWCLGGDNMARAELSIFEDREVVAIVDKDPGSSNARKKFRDLCDKVGATLTVLEKYSIENYYSLRAIRAVYPHENIPESLAELDPNKPTKDQLGFCVKGLGDRIAAELMIEELKGTDLWQFLESVRQRLEEIHGA